MFLHIQRSQSEVSVDSNTSLSGIINLQRDLAKIKFSLKDLITLHDLNEVTKDLIKTLSLRKCCGVIPKHFSKFESTLENKMNYKCPRH